MLVIFQAFISKLLSFQRQDARIIVGMFYVAAARRVFCEVTIQHLSSNLLHMYNCHILVLLGRPILEVQKLQCCVNIFNVSQLGGACHHSR